MMTAESKKVLNTVKTVLRIVVMSLIACVLLFPFFVMVTRSLMTAKEAVSVPSRLFPQTWNFASYVTAMDEDFFLHFGNTMMVIACNVICVPLSAFVVAFGFAKLRFVGSGALFAVGMSTLMLPSIVCTIPLYVLYNDLGWLNTLLPLMIPPMFGGGMMNIFLTHQFLRGIPNTYVEAARLDGAGSLRIAFTIIAPMAMPVITYIAVNTFISTWNDFTGPLTYISVYYSERWTLAVSVFERFRGLTGVESELNVQAALCVVMMLPSMILFAFFQKTLINGINMSGIKG